jgi:RNA polymerase sigma-70 factor (ECF subfamily)
VNIETSIGAALKAGRPVAAMRPKLLQAVVGGSPVRAPDAAPAARDSFEREALVHMPALFRSARRVTGNDRDAEDLVQDTFLRAFRFWGHFRTGTNARAWLFKIMHNVHINRFHQKTRSPSQVSLEAVEDYFLYTHQLESNDEGPEKAVLRGIWDREVTQALDRLPPDFKRVVLLADVGELTYQEIANIVGCPVGTVRSRLSRGRNQLQRLLADYHRRREAGEEPAGSPQLATTAA